MRRTRIRVSLSALLALSLVGAASACRQPPNTPSSPNVPIIFVHGFYGSADQYRSMAQYFASNGYDPDRIKGFDHNSVGGTTTQADLNRFIDATRQQFGVPKVHLVGHSMGTFIVGTYLNNAANLAKVEKYVLVDGSPCPGSPRIPCLGIAAASMRATAGGNQTHVEAAVSPESFARQHNFFLGRQPSSTRVLPEDASEIRIAGRVQELTVNTPIRSTTVNFWEVDEDTGHRISDQPADSVTTGSDGFFPAATVPQGRPYEIEVIRPGLGVFHAYYQKFVRTDLMLRINLVSQTSASYTNTNRGPNHSALAVVRNREFWRNHPGGNDVLRVETLIPGGGGQPEIDVLRNMTAQYVGVHLHDNAATPGQSTLQPLTYFSSQPFQTGVDVFMPAATPPNGTIRITNIPRGDQSKPQVINLPNWASNANGMSVHFNDWV